MRYLQILSPISFCLFLFGCGVTLQTNVISKDVRLRNFNKVYLVLATGAAGTSVNQANLGSVYGTASSSNSTVTAGGLGSNVGGTQVMSGQGQVNLALQDMAFELSQIGFEMVERADDAQTIAYFSIGTVRYDQLVGWIADKAFLEFRDATSKDLIAVFRAEPQFITPTVKDIVGSTARKVKAYY